MAVNIGKKTLPLPILQGGMGVGISLDRLAGAVAACGGMGCCHGPLACPGSGMPGWGGTGCCHGPLACPGFAMPWGGTGCCHGPLACPGTGPPVWPRRR